MDALILSCGTGGGHNAAGRAIQEALEAQGHRAVFMNPYALRGQKTVELVDDVYISVAQKSPRTFGFVYRLGDLYRHLPWRSPVYYFQRKTAKALETFLAQRHFDVIFCTHVYPGEALTILKNRGVALPKVLFVATDYACIPFTEETDCDAYIVPHPDLLEEFRSYGIPAQKLLPLGIPVSAAFSQDVTRQQARQALGLDRDATYLLLSGGSMGAGVLKKAVKKLYAQWQGRAQLIVICGTNDKLYKALEKRYGADGGVTLLHTTDQMPLYLRACDLYLTKPGGLSSTEAAVSGVALAHLSPIPGCETRNARFFAHLGLTVPMDRLEEFQALAPEVIAHQKSAVPPGAADRIVAAAADLIASTP